MTNSVIAIKGNYIDQQDAIFEAFGYVDLKHDSHFEGLESAATYLFDNYFNFSEKDIALRGIWTDNGWTLIFDPEMVDTLSDEPLSALSNKFNTEVFTFLIQTTSNSFAFAKYNDGIQRCFIAVDENVTENVGVPITEESGLNINERIFVDDIVSLAGKIGIDLENKAGHPVIVKQLGYNEELKMKLNSFRPAQAASASSDKKAWWKVW